MRCSYLHGGEANISKQEIQKVLEEFIFIAPVIPGNSGLLHCNRINGKYLQLMVDVFCMDVIESVNYWIDNKSDDKKILDRAENMIDIHVGNANFKVENGVLKPFKR